MKKMTGLIDVLLHSDKILAAMIRHNGTWAYGILFLFVLIEMGLIIFPFLKGDSLLLAVGALTAHAELGISLGWLIAITALAAILGDALNYWMGRELGRASSCYRVFQNLLTDERLQMLQSFFNGRGGVSVFLGRFIPVLRSLIPFAAGLSQMDGRTFMLYNILSGIVWTTIDLLLGFFLGSQTIIGDYFLVMLACSVGVLIILLTIIPSYKKQS